MMAGGIGSAAQGDGSASPLVGTNRTTETADEGKFRALLEAAPDAIVIVDQRGRISLINRQAELLFGYTRGELHGRPLETLLPERYHGRHVAHRTGYTAEPHTRPMGIGLELFGLRRDGSEFPAEISLSPRETVGELLITAVIRDVTAWRTLEREREEFFANASHDLRTPLAAIKAAIGVVLANEPPGTAPPIHRMLTNIDSAATEMSRLVDDLLELGRLQRGRAAIAPQPYDLRLIAKRAGWAIELLASERGQRLTVTLPSAPVPVLIDPPRIERALLNLLSNAQQYGRREGRIELRLELASGEAIVTVADDGPGIPAEDQPRIFERFYRSHLPATRRIVGSGLGLPIVKTLVELHGGRVAVESSPGSGSTFRITLPLISALRLPERPEEETDEDSGGR